MDDLTVTVPGRDLGDFYEMLRDFRQNRGNTFAYLQIELEERYPKLKERYGTMTKPINLHEEAFAVHWVRLAAEALSNGHTHFICNDLRLPRRLSLEQQTFLMLELISREPRPFVEYLESGCTHLRRVEVVGDGTKKSPFRAQWRDDYYRE